MINISGELISIDILARLRGGAEHETTVDFVTSKGLDAVTKSNTWTSLLPTTIIEPSSRSEGFKPLVLPNLLSFKS